MTPKLKEAIKAKDAEILAVDDDFMGEGLGVHQALGDLRKALNEVESKMYSRDFEDAASLGYKDVSSAFIFLQRALGGLHKVCMDKCGIVQDIAFDLKMPYEDVEPSVDALIASLAPKPKKRPVSAKKVKEAMKKGRDDLAHSPKRKPKGRY